MDKLSGGISGFKATGHRPKTDAGSGRKIGCLGLPQNKSAGSPIKPGRDRLLPRHRFHGRRCGQFWKAFGLRSPDRPFARFSDIRTDTASSLWPLAGGENDQGHAQHGAQHRSGHNTDLGMVEQFPLQGKQGEKHYTRKILGIRGPRMAMQPTSKAISVAMDIPHLLSSGAPHCNRR